MNFEWLEAFTACPYDDTVGCQGDDKVIEAIKASMKTEDDDGDVNVGTSMSPQSTA